MSMDHSIEVFRAVQDYPAYRVSNYGRVQTCWKHGGPPIYWYMSDDWKDLILTPNVRWKYLTVYLRGFGTPKRKPVHKLVAEAFLGPCLEGLEVCHFDGNKKNNNLSNLRYDTRKNNHADKKRHGTDGTGSRHSQAKLHESDINEIFIMRKQGLTHQEIANRFGVSRPTISVILERKQWQHVDLLP